MIEFLGLRLTLTFAAIAAAYLVWSTAPIWWSMLHVLRRRDMQQRWGFAFTGVALIYGATALIFLLFGGLMKLHGLLLQPAHLSWSWIVTPGIWAFERHPRVFPTLFAISHLLLTWWITRTLATHWTLLCARSVLPPKVPR